MVGQSLRALSSGSLAPVEPEFGVRGGSRLSCDMELSVEIRCWRCWLLRSRHRGLLGRVRSAVEGCGMVLAPGRLFIRNISIETPPLTPDKPVTPRIWSAPRAAVPAWRRPARSGGRQRACRRRAAAQSGGTVALGHTECDVVRGIGAPDNVNLSNNARRSGGCRDLFRGPRAGIYPFTAGRLTSIERGAEPRAAAEAPSRRRRRSRRTT